jgi:ribosomal protein S18 acetylase RimI-like enzyme
MNQFPMTARQAQTVAGGAGTVREAVSEDLPAIVRIHQNAFSQFFLTRLGNEFLRKYYGLVLQYRAGIVLVGEERGVLAGFACGFVDPAEFYRLMDRNRSIFVPPVLSALLRHPSLAAKVLNGVQRIQTLASEGSARSCELSSIAVSPEAGGAGLGMNLMQAFLVQAWSMEAERVYLTTDADANEPANAFYRKAGFQQTRRFLQRKGRWMNEYVADRGMHP